MLFKKQFFILLTLSTILVGCGGGGGVSGASDGKGTTHTGGGSHASAVALNQADFDAKVKNAPGAVLVDFYATWCGPCKKMHKVFNTIAQEFAGKLKVYKVDVDKNEALSNQVGVSTIPHYVLYVNGIKKSEGKGFKSVSQMKSWLQAHVK